MMEIKYIVLSALARMLSSLNMMRVPTHIVWITLVVWFVFVAMVLIDLDDMDRRTRDTIKDDFAKMTVDFRQRPLVLYFKFDQDDPHIKYLNQWTDDPP